MMIMMIMMLMVIIMDRNCPSRHPLVTCYRSLLPCRPTSCSRPNVLTRFAQDSLKSSSPSGWRIRISGPGRACQARFGSTRTQLIQTQLLPNDPISCGIGITKDKKYVDCFWYFRNNTLILKIMPVRSRKKERIKETNTERNRSVFASQKEGQHK
jgi:hypothetical protein